MELKNKLFIVLTISLILFCFCTSCFAVSSDFFNIDDNTMNVLYSTSEYQSGEYNYCVFFVGDEAWFFFVKKDVKFHAYVEVSSNGTVKLICPGDDGGYDFTLYKSGSLFKRYYDSGLVFSDICHLTATFNIYTSDTYTDFFFIPPVTLLIPMETEEIPEMIHKVLIILVPVGLIIFGMLLAPFLIKYRN